MPTVSIIMPLYNKVDYIQETLSIICSQTFDSWELIVVNDGSTDGSKAIAEKFAMQDKRIQLINQKNQGVSCARNRGLSEAKGEWIWFIDADDIPSQSFLTECFDGLNTNRPDIIAGFYNKISPPNKTEKVVLEKCGPVTNNELPQCFMKYQYSNGYWGYLWNKLIRHELIENSNSLFAEGLTLAEDLKFMVSLYRKCNLIEIVPYIAMNYRVETVNSSAEKEIDYIAQLKIQREIYDWVIAEHNEIKFLNFMKKHISCYSAFIVFYSFEREQDYILAAKKIIASEEYFSLLSTSEINGVMKMIVWCLKKKSLSLLSAYLNTRNSIRKMYRILRK